MKAAFWEVALFFLPRQIFKNPESMENTFQLSVNTEHQNQFNNLEIYREAYRKVKWKPYNNIFGSNISITVRNFESYSDLKKGEKNIIMMHLTDYFKKGVEYNESRHNSNKDMCVEMINFTPLSKDSRKNARRSIKILSNERNNQLKKLANDIFDYGIKEPEHLVDIYCINYDELLKEVNTIRSMKLEELQIILFVIKKFAKNGLVSLSRTLLSGLLTAHHNKAVVTILIKYGILKLNRKYRKYYASNRYNIHLSKIDSKNITEEKALKRVKKIELEHDRYSDEEKVEIIERAVSGSPIINDIRTMIQAKKYVFSEGDETVLEEEYKWLSNVADETTCAIYRYKPKRIYDDALKLIDTKTEMLDIFADYYYKRINEHLKNSTEYTPFNSEKSLLDIFNEVFPPAA